MLPRAQWQELKLLYCPHTFVHFIAWRFKKVGDKIKNEKGAVAVESTVATTSAIPAAKSDQLIQLLPLQTGRP